MAVRSSAAPPTPWSKNLAEPKINESAFVHSFSNIIGDVKIGAKVLVAPGTSIRADEGTPFYIGDNTNIQDGVVIHGLEQGRVKGDDGKDYSVWVGKNSSLTHMSLIHGPCYVGDNCFIGFRSTVFNAKVGKGCIVMMHALIQDVEIPPGKYVPSGAIITTQQQADRLPDVQKRDIEFATHVVGINDALRVGYRCAEDLACMISFNDGSKSNGVGYGGGKLSLEVVSHVRNLLGKGYSIGIEHADQRRFKTGSWRSAGPIQAHRENEAINAIETALQEYQDEYVRLIGVDPKAKKRVLEEIIQRPNGVVAPTNPKSSIASPAPSYSSPTATRSSDNGDLVGKVRDLVAKGYKIGIEHADQRRFKTSSWQSATTIMARSEAEAMGALQAALRQYQGEYVRLIGIDPKAKKRVLEEVIQRPDGVVVSNNGKVPTNSGQSSVSSGSTSGGSLNGSVAGQVRNLLAKGYKIGIEHADQRRFKTSSWQSASLTDSNREADILAALANSLQQYSGEYVRLIGVDPKVKKRVVEEIIQRPDAKPVATSSVATTTPSSSTPSSYGSSVGTPSSVTLKAETIANIKKLLSQGFIIGTEHADQRHFRTSSWKSCSPITSKRENEVIAALESCMKEHAGEYVRLIGIDTKAKRRVTQEIIQRPA